MEEKECYSAEAIVTCDERGQIVLPKDIRQKMDIGAGDNLAVSLIGTCKPCCIMLMKAKNLETAYPAYLKSS